MKSKKTLITLDKIVSASQISNAKIIENTKTTTVRRDSSFAGVHETCSFNSEKDSLM